MGRYGESHLDQSRPRSSETRKGRSSPGSEAADDRGVLLRREGVLVDGFVAPVGERESYHGLFSGKKHR
jgi:hypothetical protein